MKIIVIINNFEKVDDVYCNTGYMPPIKRRSVEIELTEDQKNQLRLNRLGGTGNHPLMEQIESVSILLENDEK